LFYFILFFYFLNYILKPVKRLDHAWILDRRNKNPISLHFIYDDDDDDEEDEEEEEEERKKLRILEG